ncbi:sulfotransferase family 2 domain-containing protein [Microbulbifer sp. YPW1]|uniref:sulfotransferase family 2 domain-containing protein n=1 Tax=Microbulbifer sp. YPW1 TaxID=2745199 RepID=UPI00159A2E26|nr:sulfotransferase family 2 domain-containing protein [Microbulbifer sp. YPW1]QKX15826.1 sulfotransferase family 2 domain-containing protein [Microbulbifer sp. YPW1]
MKFLNRANGGSCRPEEEKSLFDGAVDNQWGPVIRGWAKVADGGKPALVMVDADGEQHYLLASEYRNDLLERGGHPTGECGFSLNLGRRLKSPARVSVFSALGDLAPSRPAFVNKPLFFMHIAKTAGSSVNEFFIEHFGHERAAMHIESVSDLQSLAHHQFISGHIGLERFERDFERDKFYTATMLREPVRQLVSHLNWVRHLSEPERADFLQGHPDIVREISARLQKVDFSSPEAMSRFVSELRPAERPLFDNCQCRYFHSIPASKPFNDEAFLQALNNLKRFDFVGITENFEPAIRYLGAKAGIVKNWEKPPRVNVNKFDYGFDVTNPELITAVAPLIRYDQELYQRVSELSRTLLESGPEAH